MTSSKERAVWWQRDGNFDSVLTRTEHATLIELKLGLEVSWEADVQPDKCRHRALEDDGDDS